jgi:hypothetical protein
MKTQTKQLGTNSEERAYISGVSEFSFDHTEVEKKELENIAISSRFKDALTICSIDMLETGKASAFAVYKKPDECNEVSEPILAEHVRFYQFGAEKFHNWARDTGVDEFLDDQNPKKQKLFYKWDPESDKIVPRNDVRMFVIGFPMGDLQYKGFNAQNIRIPTIPLIDMFLQQDQLHSGCVFGVLTNDGKRSGMMLFKKNEKTETVDRHALECFGYGEDIIKDHMIGQMKSAGINYAEIDLNCPKNANPDKLYEKRAKQTIEALF